MSDELGQGDSENEVHSREHPKALEIEELDDAVIRRGFQFFLGLAVLLIVVAIVLMGEDPVTTSGSEMTEVIGKTKDSISVELQRSKKLPRIGEALGLSVSTLGAGGKSKSNKGASQTLAFSGGMSLMAGLGSATEIVTVSHWPEGRVRRWGIDGQGLTEHVFSAGARDLVRGWISVASIDVDGDGLEDIVTGGLGTVGCWLRDRTEGVFIWQNDACGLVVDGDAWVSSIEVLDVNGDDASDLWLNLMTKRLDGWLGKPNALWLSDSDTFRQGGNHLKSVPPSRASYASSLVDLDRDGVSEIVVSNLDGPMEVWRQLSGQPFVESRAFFGVSPVPQSEGAVLVGELDGDPMVAFPTKNGPLAYVFPPEASGLSVDHLFKALDLNDFSLRQVSWWDYDLDGFKDLLLVGEDCLPEVAEEGCRSRLLFRHEKMTDGVLHAFSTPSFAQERRAGLHLLWDLDEDGDEDFVVMGVDGTLHLRSNTTDLEHQWIGLSVSRRWVGAELLVVTSDGHSHREVLQNSSGRRINQGLWRRFGLKDAHFVNLIRLQHPREGTKEAVGAQPLNTWIHID